MKQVSFISTSASTMSVMPTTAEALMSQRIDQRSEALYDEAKKLFKEGFAFVVIDAEDVPEDILGEIVELEDMFYPANADEPMFDVVGVDSPVPLSALTCVQ